MSLFSWLTRKTPAPAPRPRQAPAPFAAPTAPAGAARKPLPEPQPPATDGPRKNERMERRELLYAVVRDAMVRSGVLSAGYKFKVLSLDARGAQFLVMVDLAQDYGSDTARLKKIEALLTQAARTRFDILVTAVYWRVNEQITANMPQPVPAPPAAARAAPAPGAAVAAPPIIVGPRPEPAAEPQPPVLPPRPAPQESAGAPRFDPIEADEVAAFKQALVSAAAARRAPAPATPGTTTRSGRMLPPSPPPTGFEDTVMPGQDGRSPDLSTTQYGELN